jgi:hypothetical protein
MCSEVVLGAFSFPPELMDRNQLARRYGISMPTVGWWVQGGLPSIPCPCGCVKRYFVERDVEKWRANRPGARRERERAHAS